MTTESDKEQDRRKKGAAVRCDRETWMVASRSKSGCRRGSERDSRRAVGVPSDSGFACTAQRSGRGKLIVASSPGRRSVVQDRSKKYVGFELAAGFCRLRSNLF